MIGLVFAAGRGSRLRPRTDQTPKPLLEIAGKPLLSWCLQSVVEADVDEIANVVGYRSDDIVDYVGTAFESVPVTYVLQEERRGLAHAVECASTVLSGEVLCVNADNVFECDLSILTTLHRGSNVDGTILLDQADRNDGSATSICTLADDGTIRQIEVDSSNSVDEGYIAAGAQTHHGPTLLEACRDVERASTGEYELADALKLLVERGNRYVGVELDGWHMNVNTPDDFAAVDDRWSSQPRESSELSDQSEQSN